MWYTQEFRFHLCTRPQCWIGFVLIALPKFRLRTRNPVRMWMGVHELRKRLFSVSKGRRLGMYNLIFALHCSPHGHPRCHTHTFVSLAIFCMYILPCSESSKLFLISGPLSFYNIHRSPPQDYQKQTVQGRNV